MSWLLLVLACSTAPAPTEPEPIAVEVVHEAPQPTDEDTGVLRHPELLDLPGEVAFVDLQERDAGYLLEHDFDGDGTIDALHFASLERGDQLARLELGGDRRDRRFVIRVRQHGGAVTLIFRRVHIKELRALMGWT